MSVIWFVTHPTLRVFQRRETQWRINAVCISSREQPSHRGEIRVFDCVPNHRPTQPVSAMRQIHPNITDVGKSSFVGYDSQVTHLLLSVESGEHQGRMPSGSFDLLLGDAGRPIGCRQPSMNS